MNKTIATAALVAVIATGLVSFFGGEQKPVLSLELGLMHQNWMLTEGKGYSSPAEQSFRLGVFQANLEKIREHNADSSKTWTMGLNQFSDMTDEELHAKYTTGRAFELSSQGHEDLAEFKVNSLSQTAPPNTVDHRIFAPTTVLNQGRCGSCWAFSTAVTASIAFNRRFGGVQQFSPQQLLSCSNAGTCNGGIHPDAINFYTKVGPTNEQAYPYADSQTDISKP